MLPEIRDKIRALVSDIGTSQSEPFTYTNSKEFPLCGDTITEILSVQVNDADLQSGESYEFNSDTNRITLDADLNENDIVTVMYKYYKYSDSELDEFIKQSLIWLSIFGYCSDEDFEIEDDDIYPTPSNKEEDLISLISSILILPDYKSYKLPNVTVTYPKTMPKEKRIEELIIKFRRGLGKNDIIEWNV